jgi:DNA-binding GntR family transcriptional regulator
MARYREIADDLRARIQRGEFPVGSKLPGISALMEEYDVPGLNTIRGAQQLLVEEGMLESRQGVGVFVTSAKSLRQVDIVGELTPGTLARAIEHLAQAIEHLADVVATTATH